MALAINSNIASLSAQRFISKTTGTLNTAYQRLASGMRINTAKDDAAGLSIANRFTAQIRGLNQAGRNANDAISLAQVAEGALDETTNALQRIRELAVQASNDTYTTADRSSIQAEIDQLVSEINRIASNTEFNNQALLDSTFSGKAFQVGADASQTISISISGAGTSTTGLGFSTTSITVSAGSAGSQQLAAMSAITTMDAAIDTVNSMRGRLGAVQNRFESVVNNLANVAENLAASRSRIQDTDVAEETARLTSATIKQQAGVAILSQANQQPTLALQLLGS